MMEWALDVRGTKMGGLAVLSISADLRGASNVLNATRSHVLSFLVPESTELRGPADEESRLLPTQPGYTKALKIIRKEAQHTLLSEITDLRSARAVFGVRSRAPTVAARLTHHNRRSRKSRTRARLATRRAPPIRTAAPPSSAGSGPAPPSSAAAFDLR